MHENIPLVFSISCIAICISVNFCIIMLCLFLLFISYFYFHFSISIFIFISFSLLFLFYEFGFYIPYFVNYILFLSFSLSLSFQPLRALESLSTVILEYLIISIYLSCSVFSLAVQLSAQLFFDTIWQIHYRFNRWFRSLVDGEKWIILIITITNGRIRHNKFTVSYLSGNSTTLHNLMIVCII